MDFSALTNWLAAINNKDVIVATDSSVSMFCILLLILVLFVDKKLSSSSIGILVLCLGEGLGSILLPSMIQIASTEALLNYFVWYGGWMALHIACMTLLLKFHRVYRLRVSDVSMTLAWYYAILVFMEGVDFIDRATLDSGFFATFYQLGNILLGALIGPVVGLLFFREYYQRHRQLKMQEY